MANKDFVVALDKLAEGGTALPATQGGEQTIADIDAQIKALKSDPKYRNGNAHERKQIMDQITDLFEKKVRLGG